MIDFPMSTRREFLRNGASLLCAGATVPTFLSQTVLAIDNPSDAGLTTSRPGVPEERILVVVQLAGGNDGLNTVVPYRADRYYEARPTLAIGRDAALKLNDEVGLHPAARDLKALYDSGDLCVVQQVGYPNPNRSHFKSMDIWETASPEGRLHSGWIGRYFDNQCPGADACDPQSGIALMNESPLAMRGESFAPVSFDNPDDLSLQPIGRYDARAVIESLNRPRETPDTGGNETELDFLTRTALNAQVSAETIRRAARKDDGNEFPNTPLGRSLRNVSRMIAAELSTRVYYVSLGGFDTHARQANPHRSLLNQLAQSLKAFVGALKRNGHYERVCVMTFSEFGRRVEENGSGGTDHGEAAPMFLLGGGVKPGVVGPAPDLRKLNRGDLPFAIDFRRVYAGVLKSWMGADPAAVLKGTFQPLPMFKDRT